MVTFTTFNEWLSYPPVKIALIITIALLARLLIHFALRNGLNLILKINPKQAAQLNAPVRTLSQILSSIVTVLIVLIATINILDVLKFNTAAILTSAGVITLIAGIASQNLLKDLVAGISLLVDAKYHVGDCISVVNVTGEITTLGLKTTTIQDRSGNIHIIPNSEIKMVSKITHEDAEIEINLPHGDYIESVIELLKKELPKKNIGDTIDNDYAVKIKSLKNGVKLNIIIKTKPLKKGVVEMELNEAVLRILTVNNIKLKEIA